MPRLLLLLVTLAALLVAAAPAAADPSASVTLAAEHGRLDAGRVHTCAVQPGGVVRCWGGGGEGRLGTGSTETVGDLEHPAAAPPVALGAGRTALAVTAGGEHSCALLDDHSVRCWGDGAAGRLGTGSIENVGDDEPASAGAVVDLGPHTAKAIAAGTGHTCAILDDDTLRCWGDNDHGQLGYGDTTDVLVPAQAGPVPLPAGRTVRAVAAGGDHTCAILDDFQLRCWGDGAFGATGHGNTDDVEDASAGLPLYLGAGRSARAVAIGDNHGCALLDDATLRCWGVAANGQLGYGNEIVLGDDETAGAGGPVSVGGPAKAITVGQLSTCAILVDDTLRCWGAGDEGELGLGAHEDVGDDELPSDAPATTPGPGRKVVASAGGAEFGCWRLDDGAVRCTGWSTYGQPGTAGNDPLYPWYIQSEKRTLAAVPDVLLAGAGTDVSAWARPGSMSAIAVGAKRKIEVAVVNAGPDAVGGVVVTLEPSAGLTLAGDPVWNAGTLQPGVAKTIEVEVTATAAGARPLVAEVTAAGAPDADSTPGNGAAAAEDDDAAAAVPVVPGADLSVDAAFATGTLVRPGKRPMTVTVANAGPDPATNVKVATVTGSGRYAAAGAAPTAGTYDGSTWNVGTLAAGQSATLQVDVAANEAGTKPLGANLLFTPEPDPDTADRTDTQPLTVVDGADMEVTLTGGLASLQVGQTTHATLVVRNQGGGATTEAAVDLEAPAGLEVVRVIGPGTWDAAQRRLSTELTSGLARSFQVEVKGTEEGERTLGAVLASSTAPDHDSTPGNPASADEDDNDVRTITVTPAPAKADPPGTTPPSTKPPGTTPPPTTPPTTTPVTTPPTVTPQPFAALRAVAVTVRRGLPRLTLDLRRPATLRVTLSRRLRGTWRTVGTATLRGAAGRSAQGLPRALTGRRLRRGAYRLVVAADGVALTRSFRVR